MRLNVKTLSAESAAAIFAYLLRGGAVNRYAIGARALPPSYHDSNPKPPRIYCIHNPVAA